MNLELLYLIIAIFAVILIGTRLKFFDPNWLVSKRIYWIVFSIVLAVVFSPVRDPLNLAIPTLILIGSFELAVWLSKRFR